MLPPNIPHAATPFRIFDTMVIIGCVVDALRAREDPPGGATHQARSLARIANHAHADRSRGVPEDGDRPLPRGP